MNYRAPKFAVIAIVAALGLCGVNAFAQNDHDRTVVSPSSVQGDGGAQGSGQVSSLMRLNSPTAPSQTITPAAHPRQPGFSANKVLFINWQITFKNRLYNLSAGGYRVDAVYTGPNLHTLSVDDAQIVLPS